MRRALKRWLQCSTRKKELARQNGAKLHLQFQPESAPPSAGLIRVEIYNEKCCDDEVLLWMARMV